VLKNLINKNDKLYWIIIKFYFFFRHIIVSISAKFRSIGLLQNSKYADIKKFKGIHDGERCFIIATGPSLTIEDLNKLKDEYTFSMNSIILVFDETDWRPTYYGIQDHLVYDKLKDCIFRSKLKNIFIGSYLNKRCEVPEDSIVFPLDLLDHVTMNPKRYNTKFSSDCYAKVYDGYTITYSLMQIAVYMGFKEIYLLGVDCNYTQNKNYFKDHGVQAPDSLKDNATERMSFAYQVAKNYCDKHGVKIYNATRGGMLEVYSRVDLDKVLGRK